MRAWTKVLGDHALIVDYSVMYAIVNHHSVVYAMDVGAHAPSLVEIVTVNEALM